MLRISTNSNQSSHSCYCLICVCVCAIWFFTSQSKNQLCRDGSSCVDPVLSKINASCSRTQCKLGPATPRSQVKHSTTEPLRPPPLCCLKKMQCNTVMRDKIVYTELLVISFAACFFCFFFVCFFTANHVDPASSGSSFEPCHKIAAINVAFLHE